MLGGYVREIYEEVRWLCEGVICGRGVREARLDINLLCCLHKCPIKNITDITQLLLLRLFNPLYVTVHPALTGGWPIRNLVTKSSTSV